MDLLFKRLREFPVATSRDPAIRFEQILKLSRRYTMKANDCLRKAQELRTEDNERDYEAIVHVAKYSGILYQKMVHIAFEPSPTAADYEKMDDLFERMSELSV